MAAKVKCYPCKGTGMVGAGKAKPCGHCNGTGKVKK